MLHSLKSTVYYIWVGVFNGVFITVMLFTFYGLLKLLIFVYLGHSLFSHSFLSQFQKYSSHFDPLKQNFPNPLFPPFPNPWRQIRWIPNPEKPVGDPLFCRVNHGYVTERLGRKPVDVINSNIVEKCDVILSRAVHPFKRLFFLVYGSIIDYKKSRCFEVKGSRGMKRARSWRGGLDSYKTSRGRGKRIH